MKKRTQWLILLITLPFTFAIFAFWGSISDSNLETHLITKSDRVITNIERHPYGKAGLVVVTEDKNGKGEVLVFVRLIPSDRYQLTKTILHNKKDVETFAGLDIYNSYSLSLDNHVFKVMGMSQDSGYLWVLCFKLIAGFGLSLALSATIMLVSTKKNKTKTEM